MSGCAAPALPLLGLIHPTSGKVRSRKFASRIVHNPGPISSRSASKGLGGCGRWLGPDRGEGLREPHRRRAYGVRRITERPSKNPVLLCTAPARRIKGGPLVSASSPFLQLL